MVWLKSGATGLIVNKAITIVKKATPFFCWKMAGGSLIKFPPRRKKLPGVNLVNYNLDQPFFSVPRIYFFNRCQKQIREDLKNEIWYSKSTAGKKKVSASQQPQNEMQTCVPTTPVVEVQIVMRLILAKLSELSRNFSWQQLLTSVIEKSSEFHTQLTKFASFYSSPNVVGIFSKEEINMLKSTQKTITVLTFFSVTLFFVFYTRPQTFFQLN